MTATHSTSCPRCGAATSGNFCAACGAPLGTATCRSCGTPLAAGASFCQECRTAVTPSHPAASGPVTGLVTTAKSVIAAPNPDRTPWLIAGVLIILIIAGVLYSANRRSAPEVPAMDNAGNGGGVVTGVAANSIAGCAPTGPVPDISKLTPKQQFVHLVDRVNRWLEKGDTVCVVTFTPMALNAYANLTGTDRDVDAQYHAAMLQAQVGMFDNARALADSIMTKAPDNLFGYYVRAATAEFAGDSANAKAARADFRAHFDAEMKKNRPEYAEHRPFLEQYRTGDGAR